MNEHTKTSFDPHYWEKCFVFTCRKGQCPFVKLCFRAQKDHENEMKKFIGSLNKKITEGFDLTNLSPTDKGNLFHLIKKHGLKLTCES
jgi:hypothetical protein